MHSCEGEFQPCDCAVRKAGYSALLLLGSFAVSSKNAGDITIQRVVSRNGAVRWAVRQDSAVLNTDGQWEHEPLPSSRDEAFLRRCRFPTVQAAARAAMASAGRCWSEADAESALRSAVESALFQEGPQDRADDLAGDSHAELSPAEVRCLLSENRALRESLRRARQQLAEQAPLASAASLLHARAETRTGADNCRLHVYPQIGHHFPLQVVGTHEGLTLLQHAIGCELNATAPMLGQRFLQRGLQAYEVQIRCVTAQRFESLPAPYCIQQSAWSEEESMAFHAALERRADAGQEDNPA